MQQMQRKLGRSRDAIKGIAILWVVFFHANMGLSGLIYDLQKIGYGVVDLMLFLMGFGLYHSLKKNDDLGGYMKRRAWRLLPSYLPFCIVWLAVTLTHSIFRIGPMEKVIAEEALDCSWQVCEVVPAALGESIGDMAAISVAVTGWEELQNV